LKKSLKTFVFARRAKNFFGCSQRVQTVYKKYFRECKREHKSMEKFGDNINNQSVEIHDMYSKKLKLDACKLNILS